MARGVKPGTPKQPNSGRVKGQPNKATKSVIEMLINMGCDPIAGMARIGMDAEAEGDKILAGNMYKELAQYVAPKRKAIEHTGNNGEPLLNLADILKSLNAAKNDT